MWVKLYIPVKFVIITSIQHWVLTRRNVTSSDNSFKNVSFFKIECPIPRQTSDDHPKLKDRRIIWDSSSFFKFFSFLKPFMNQWWYLQNFVSKLFKNFMNSGLKILRFFHTYSAFLIQIFFKSQCSCRKDNKSAIFYV